MATKWRIRHADLDFSAVEQVANELRLGYSRVRVVRRTLSALGTSVDIYAALYDPSSARESTPTVL